MMVTPKKPFLIQVPFENCTRVLKPGSNTFSKSVCLSWRVLQEYKRSVSLMGTLT
jgi:hypothetical protein